MDAHSQFAARAFGFAPVCCDPPTPATLPLPAPGQVLALLGPSGSGKTLALNALRLHHGGVAPALPQGRPPHESTPVLELFAGIADSERVLRGLASCGLADGRLWQLPVRCLSAGEYARLRVAHALLHCRDGDLLVLDEFDTHLDELAACAMAQTVARVAQRRGLRVAASTHRPALLPYLGASRVLRLGTDGALHEDTAPAPRALADELEIVPARRADYARYARWHYLGPGLPGPTSHVFTARLRGEDVAIAMFGYPHLLLAARRQMLPARFHPVQVRRRGAAALNLEVRNLQRVIVDPRVRGAGVACALLRHALPQLGVRWVECVAQLGQFSDFLLRAGFAPGPLIQPRCNGRLHKLLARLGLDASALLDASMRQLALESLPPADAAALAAALAAVARSRVQTGHGHGRASGRVPEAALDRALARLHARPRYFVHDAGVLDERP